MAFSGTMVKQPFNGQLNSNRVYESIASMILKQVINNPKIAHNNKLIDMFTDDVGLAGDTVLYYSVDVLETKPWLGHKNTVGEIDATNILETSYAKDPNCQAVTIDTYRQLSLTTDEYLSRQAFATGYAFSDFTSIMISMMNTTKEMYMNTLFNTKLGTTEADETDAPGSVLEVPISDITATGEEKNRLEAQMIGQYIADLLVDLKDYSRDYNELGYVRAYNDEDLVFVWNSAVKNKILKIDLPTIYNNGNIVNFDKTLPARYFGHVTTSADAGEGGAIASNRVQATAEVRSLVEKTVGAKHYFPGDRLPTDTTVGGSSAAFLYSEAYIVDPDIICKVMTKDTWKVLSAFTAHTEFFNPKSLNTNRWITFGFGIDRLVDQPCITIYAD